MPKRRVNRHAVTQPLDQSIRLIPLTKGQNAIVDASDYEWLNQWNWIASWSKYTRSFSAARMSSKDGFVRMSRQILNFPPDIVDHRNRDTLDNRRENLRKSTRSGNASNSPKRKVNTSGYKGVFRSRETRKAWKAQICYQGKIRYLGVFDSKEQAARAYDAAAIFYQGEFAILNFPHATLESEGNSEPKSPTLDVSGVPN